MDSRNTMLSSIETPYDDVMPSVDEPSAKFYIEAIRVYLGICAGTVSFKQALRVVEELKQNSEFAKYPIDPTVLPVNDDLKDKLLENLRTARKYKLCTAESIKSAYSFAVLNQDAPASTRDAQVLRYFASAPTDTLVECSDALGFTPRTVSRSLKRLRERNSVRFGCIIDQSAFGVISAIVFFKLSDDIEWEYVQAAISEFPFTKALLKTSISPFGYFSLLFPNSERNRLVLRASLEELSGRVFTYTSYHEQQASGAVVNLSLFSNNKWQFTDKFQKKLEKGSESDSPPVLLGNRGEMINFRPRDYAVLSQFTADVRASPSEVSTRLRSTGWDLDSRQVSHIYRRMRDEDVFLPYVTIGGMGLSASFCFEILCTPDWRKPIISAVAELPQSMYYLSDKGVIVWTRTPPNHQVEYYQVFRSLEQHSGVKSVESIMTISLKGSRSMYDIADKWDYVNGNWQVPSHILDLSGYFF
ncbi:MAG: hypothetical protein ACOC38_01710 [Promethearchaeia archaeon]